MSILSYYIITTTVGLIIAPIVVKFSHTSYEKQKHLVPGKSFVPTGETDSRAHP